MSIKLAGYLFTGPFPLDTTEVRANQAPVVYAVVAKGGQSWAPIFRVVDLGVSPEQGLRFADHPCRTNWVAEHGESLSIYLFYAPRSAYSLTDREEMAARLRGQYDPPRGFVA